MDAHPEAPLSEAIDLYVHTYTSLLRSSGEVRVRAFEEAHAYSGSSLHAGALSPTPDISAFAYAAARLPSIMLDVDCIVLGQSHELFEAAGFDVRAWKNVRTRGRRRPIRWDGHDTLAVFIASSSDIDDLVPIVTAYQIEWNKMHERLRGFADAPDLDAATIAQALTLDVEELGKLGDAFGAAIFEQGIRAVATRPLDLKMRMLAPSYSQYQRAAQRWWSGVEPAYVRSAHPRRGPVYFVSSNTHAIANLVGGYALTHQDRILDYIRARNPEGLAERAFAAGMTADDLAPLLYYALRGYIHDAPGEVRMNEVRAFEVESGLLHLNEPGHIDVDAQIVELRKLDPARIDPRLRVPGVEKLARSDAFLLNIDYPLGMAAYHLLSRLGQGVGELRGVYVMGKAATLNGRVGDVALSGMVYDEHSQSTFLFRNAFGARDVRPYLRHGSVFDNQSALTVRSAFLQNKHYMSTFYREGYTVLEMEAGPFLSAVYELVHPVRVPTAEIVHLSAHTPFDVGILHYASDTPYSRRQSLLSKSLSYFGVDSTYACAIAIVRRILEQEVARVSGIGTRELAP
jgi:hypothetical protein